jgi:hypothetical protein
MRFNISFVIINDELSYLFFACRCNRKLILASYHDYYTFMLRVTCVSVRNGYHDEENVSFESGNWLLHEFLSILCSLTWTLLVVATGSKLLVSYHEVYTFMLPVTCITARNECHDRKNVRFASSRWLLHLLSSIMCCYVFFACCRNRKFILVSYLEDYNFMLQCTFVTASNGCHDRNNVSFEGRNWLLHLLSIIMCSLTCGLSWYRNRKFMLVWYHEDYNFKLRTKLSTGKVLD